MSSTTVGSQRESKKYHDVDGQRESKKYHDVDKGYSWIILIG